MDTDVNSHLVKTFLDIIVLKMLGANPTHGYGLIADIHKRFDVLLSPGTLYPLLYSLEKKKFIGIQKEGRRKNYFLTETGEKQADSVINSYKDNIRQLIRFLD